MRSVADIQTDLTEARAARSKLLTRGQAEGHDGSTVSRVSLKDLSELIASLENELAYAQASSPKRVSFTPTIGVR